MAQRECHDVKPMVECPLQVNRFQFRAKRKFAEGLGLSEATDEA